MLISSTLLQLIEVELVLTTVNKFRCQESLSKVPLNYKLIYLEPVPSDVSSVEVPAQGKENSPPRPHTKQHHAGGKGQSHYQCVSIYSFPQICVYHCPCLLSKDKSLTCFFLLLEADFGLAKQKQENSKLTSVVGTILYSW